MTFLNQSKTAVNLEFDIFLQSENGIQTASK